MRTSRFSSNFSLGETKDTGNWTKKEPGLSTTQSGTGEITDRVCDSFDDSKYMRQIPQDEVSSV